MVFYKQNQQGFSLIELSIVLLIIGALAGSIVVPLSSSFEFKLRRQSLDQLQLIKLAIIGFTASHGYLPCPIRLRAIDGSVAASQAAMPPNTTAGSIHCGVHSGGVPAALLGVAGSMNERGALLDVWGRPYLYRVSDVAFAKKTLASKSANETDSNWLSIGALETHAITQLRSSINICRNAKQGRCAKQNVMASQLVWLVLTQASHSPGRNSAEKENTDEDSLFVAQPFSQSAINAFDDQLVWASQSEMVFWLLKANWFQ